MNRIIITGRLTKDPELRTTTTGTEVCNFTVAVDRRKKKDADRETDYFDVSAWTKLGSFVNTYFRKGDGITVEGRMESRKYVDKDGNNRTSWGLTAEQVEFGLGKGKSSQSSPTPPATFTDVSDAGSGDLPF